MGVFKRFVREPQRGLFQYLKSSRLAQGLFALCFLFVALMIAFPLWRLLPVVADNPFIPLHYNIYIGIDRFGVWWSIFVLPVTGFVILVVNMMLAAAFSSHKTSIFGKSRDEPVLSNFFLYMAPIVNLILLVAMGLIILLSV